MEHSQEPSEREKRLAGFCKEHCPVCRRARSKQRGLAYLLTRYVDAPICPACRAYKKVYGRPSYEPEPE